MQFVVPQFIEVEAKIIGPISARQFIIILLTIGLSFGWFQLFASPFLFIPTMFITLAIGGILAFAKVNGQSMHYFLLNLIQTLRRPRLKIWERMPYAEITELLVEEEKVVERKAQATTSRLAEVSLMVDTGGAYQSDDERSADASAVALSGAPQAGQEQAGADEITEVEQSEEEKKAAATRKKLNLRF